jgi:hypothetical protein
MGRCGVPVGADRPLSSLINGCRALAIAKFCLLVLPLRNCESVKYVATRLPGTSRPPGQLASYHVRGSRAHHTGNTAHRRESGMRARHPYGHPVHLEVPKTLALGRRPRRDAAASHERACVRASCPSSQSSVCLEARLHACVSRLHARWLRLDRGPLITTCRSSPAPAEARAPRASLAADSGPA